MNCRWCGRDNRRPSEWEQETLSGTWSRLCAPCARRRLRNPYNALLAMRKVAK